MNVTQQNRWHRAADRLRGHFGCDFRNNRGRRDPWWCAAHSMVQIWRNIASQGRLGFIPRKKESMTSWNEAANSMKALLNGRRRTRLEDPTTWRYWAGHLPRPQLRYVPKAKRGPQG